MLAKRHRVAVVLDRNFGEALVALARRVHVWIVESPANTRWARQIWQERDRASDSDPLASGVTCFASEPRHSAQAAFLSILETVDDHHGGYAHEPGWTELEIYDLECTAEIASELKGYGVERIEARGKGFIAFRTPPTPAGGCSENG